MLGAEFPYIVKDDGKFNEMKLFALCLTKKIEWKKIEFCRP